MTYVAAQAGHSLQTLSRHYAGVLAELEDGAPGLGDGHDPRRAANLWDAHWTRWTRPQGLS